MRPETKAAPAPARAVFLDRDGVINVDRGFTHRPEDLVFTSTAVAAIAWANRAGYRVIVVTNQSGVARGLYGVGDVERFHEAIQTRLVERGAYIDAFYYCAYHPEGSVAEFAREHEDRKPNAGMILRAMRDWNLQRDGSFMVGDRQSDLDAAAAAGIPALLIPGNDGDLLAAVRQLAAT